MLMVHFQPARSPDPGPIRSITILARRQACSVTDDLPSIRLPRAHRAAMVGRDFVDTL